ncbi:MAG: ubiG 1 [Acidobacteria bacterium]|nr:ubiG 1 [Acidobacteriota bacterium]
MARDAHRSTGREAADGTSGTTTGGRTWTHDDARPGPSAWRDIVDWVGGYPHEAATAERVSAFLGARGFSIGFLRCRGGLGCSEFVFWRPSPPDGLPARG